MMDDKPNPRAEQKYWRALFVAGPERRPVCRLSRAPIALARAGFPVPDGFVLTTAAFDRFLEANGLGPESAADAISGAVLPSDVADAVRTAVGRAAITVHNLKWFKVTETRGYIKDGKIAQWQVSVDLGFALE